LEQLAAKFNKKASMREKWLNDSQKLVISDQFGFDLESVEAAFKKQEAIQTDIGAFEDRVRNVIDIAKVLDKENYHDIEKINARKRNVFMLWNYLLDLVKMRRQRLESCYSLQKIFQEMQQIGDYLSDLDRLLLIDNYGKQLISVEDLIERHKVTEADIGLVGERVDRIINEAGQFIDQMKSDESSESEQANNPLYQSYRPLQNYEQVIYDRIAKLQTVYENTKQLSKQRRDKLAEAHKFWQLMEDIAEEDLWISEKIQQLTVPSSEEEQHGGSSSAAAASAAASGPASALVTGAATSNRYRIKPNIIENEMNAHRQTQFDKLEQEARELVSAATFGHEQVEQRMNYLNARWLDLLELVKVKQEKQRELQETKQFFTDAEDVDSYLYELSRMLTQSAMDDYYVGKDEINVINLLKKHKDLEDEFAKYKQSIINIHDQAANLPSLKRLDQQQQQQSEGN
jgi:spectrin beta